MNNQQEPMNLKRRHNNLFCLLISFLLIATPLLSNDNINRTLGKAQAAEDLRLYFKLIDEQHGNPYQYVSRSAFFNAIEETIIQLPESIDIKSFELELSKLNNLIRCGHTTVNLPTEVFKYESNLDQFFPIPVSIIDGEIYVDFDQTKIPHGSKIISINNIELKHSIRDLTQLTVTDGLGDTKPLGDLESRFGYYFYLQFGGFKNFNVKYQSPEGALNELSIAGVAGHKMMANHYFRPLYQSHERYYHFTHLDAIDSLHTMVLTLNTFQANPDWFYQRISSRYDEEAKVFDFSHLVLDLRQNEGGDRRILNFLYEFLTGKELVDPSQSSTRTLSIKSPELLEGINGSLSSRGLILQAERYLAEHFVLQSEEGYKAEEQNWHETFDAGIHWAGEAFEGQIYVLTSGKTFSAAADFTRILGAMDNVSIVGEETGGANVGRTANMLLNYSLPNTGTMVQIPVIYEEFVNTNKIENAGRGTFPDYYVKQSYTDLLGQKDAPFDFALGLIQNNLQQGSN